VNLPIEIAPRDQVALQQRDRVQFSVNDFFRKRDHVPIIEQNLILASVGGQ